MRYVVATVILCLILFSPSPSYALDVTASNNVTISATVGIDTTGGGGSGGGGGGYSAPTNVTFSGRAYPLSRVILLRDGQEVVNTVSGPDARFTVSINSLSTGTYTFSILSEDSARRRSTLFTIPISVTAGVSTTISGIFIAPTIAINGTEIRRGDTLTIFGQTAPNAMVTIEVHSQNQLLKTIPADQSGIYLYKLNTAPLEYGGHTTRSKSELLQTNEVTSYSDLLQFTVGDKTVLTNQQCGSIADFNKDCRVNIVDFSLMAYWYRRALPPTYIDLNHDGKITIADFSILAYYWNG